ncbi:hypothetical protein SH139x_002040 [Planctomycetaceae bacterium SH139]
MTAAIGKTFDLIDQTRPGPLTIHSSESLNVSDQLVDFAGDPSLKAGLVAFLVTLFDEATETVINDVDQQDRRAQVEADGSFTLKLNGEDNVIGDPASVGSGRIERNVLTLYWPWHDGGQDRSGISYSGFGSRRWWCRFFQRRHSVLCCGLGTR